MSYTKFELQELEQQRKAMEEFCKDLPRVTPMKMAALLLEDNFRRKLRKVEEENVQLRAELAALKTPHPCVDCDRLSSLNCGDFICGVPTNGAYYVVPHKPWLCGHFQQKKGTQ